MKQVDVAIGLVWRAGRVLICRRKLDTHLGGFWEFPGGKREADESIHDCLIRELREELAIEVEILTPLPIIEHPYPDVHVRLHPFQCRLRDGDAHPLASQEIRWIEPHQLREYDFPPANDSLLDQVARLRPPH